MRLALSLAAAKAGNSIAARMAMMAMTTSSSMSVKAAGFGTAGFREALGEFRFEVFMAVNGLVTAQR